MLFLFSAKNYKLMIQYNVDLTPCNTFNAPAKAKYFVDITKPTQFSQLMEERVFQNTQDKLFLWGGSNVLLTQDYDGLVIHNSIDTMRILDIDEEKVKIMVGGGKSRHELVMRAAERGRWGIENLALIPGSVWAAPVQNIGAYGVEVKDVITSVKWFDLQTGDLRALNPMECHFGYRDSVFKHELKDKFFITHVTFVLSKKPNPRLTYRWLEDLSSGATPLDIVQKIIAIRQSKLPDETKIGTAGSFFRNPIVALDVYDKLCEEYTDLVGREMEDKDLKGCGRIWKDDRPVMMKLSAAQLIELAGFPRGTKDWSVGSYEDHALVLVNEGGTGAEVRDFAQRIMRGVKDMFGVELDPEVRVI
jgi:UDP-N-acetylmuramate dehydrogenase